MKFEDIKFKQRAFGGISAQVELKDEMILSIIGGQMAYSTPREDLTEAKDFASFEIAILDRAGEFVTSNHIADLDDDVKGWVNRDEILEIIKKLTK